MWQEDTGGGLQKGAVCELVSEVKLNRAQGKEGGHEGIRVRWRGWKWKDLEHFKL